MIFKMYKFIFIVFCLFIFLIPHPAIADWGPASLHPPDNGNLASINLNDNLVISFFHNPMNPILTETWNKGSSGSIVLLKKPQGLFEFVVESFDVNSPRISGHNTHIVGIDPTNTLDDNSCYIVRVGGCAVVSNTAFQMPSDCDGKAFLKIDFYEWNFTTGNGVCDFDVTSLITENASLLHLSPPNNATQFQKNQSLNLTFSKNVTANQGNFILKKYDDNSVLETIPVSSPQVTGWGTSHIIINPSVNFIDNTKYYVNMDLANFRSASDKDNWTFTIQKYPSVLSGSGL
jgi:Bacterial Ig-like domain